MTKNILFGLFLVAIIGAMFIDSSVVRIIYGVCIFLYAMSVLNGSLGFFTGIDKFLQKMTKTRVKGFVVGATMCTLMQSSGLVSVLAISFLSAGFITLSAGLAIIIGTNFGCISGSWLVAGLGVKISIAKYAMPMVVVGLYCLVSNKNTIKGIGYFIFSIGLLLLGIDYMKSGFDNIKETIDLSKYAMEGVAGLLVYTLIGIIITVIMQSSHATLTLAISALSVSQITYDNCIAITIGSQIGSTIMSVIAAISANTEGRKLTVTHIAFNTVSAIIMLVFIKFFIHLTDVSAQYLGIADDNYTIKVAIFHTYFNLVGTVIFYPCINLIEKLLNRFIKSSTKRSKVSTAKYLSDEALEFSNSALKVLAKETVHLYENTSSIIAKAISISKEDVKSDMRSWEIIKLRNKPMEIDFDELYNNRFKEVYSQIIDYTIAAVVKADEKDASSFMDIRRSAILMAEILKNIKNIHSNISKFMVSSNEYIAEEYDKLRVGILQSLRLMDKIINFDPNFDAKTQIKDLTAIYYALDDEESNVDVLLASKRITNTMASSIINDTMFARNMTRELLKIAELVVAHANEFDFSVIKEELEINN